MDKKTFTITEFYYDYFLFKDELDNTIDRANVGKKAYEDDVRFTKQFLNQVLKGLHIDSFFEDYCKAFNNQFRKPWDKFFESIAVIYKTKVQQGIKNKDAQKIRNDLRNKDFSTKELIGTESYNSLLQELSAAVIYNDIDNFAFSNRLINSDISLATQSYAAKLCAQRYVEEYINNILSIDESKINNKEKAAIIRNFNMNISSFIQQCYSNIYVFETDEKTKELCFAPQFDDVKLGKVVSRDKIKTYPNPNKTDNAGAPLDSN